MKNQFVRFSLVLALVFGAFFAPRPAAVGAASRLLRQPQASVLASPAGLLNPDGSLRLQDSSFSGSLNLDGWNVRLDPQRGPVFESGGQPAPAAPTGPAGLWNGLGYGLQALNGPVYAIAVNGSDVYIGGDFTDAGGIQAADYVAKWDGSSWSALGSSWMGSGCIQGTVQALALSGTDLYVGGNFNDVFLDNHVVLYAADKIARWDGSTWHSLGSNGAGDGVFTSSAFDRVKAIAVSGSTVYIGGYFSDLNNIPTADHIARFNGTTWSALGSNGAGNGSLNASVSALALIGTDLYAGGDFYNVNNNGTPLPTADYIARWSGGSWAALGSDGAGDGALNNTVQVLTASGSALYVGGFFQNVHNGILALPSADYIARWDGSFWYALGTGSGDGALDAWVDAIAVSGTDVYAGGHFHSANNKGTLLPAASKIARFDGSNWSALGDDGSGAGCLTNGDVEAVAISGASVYAGGFFYNLKSAGTILSAGNFIASWTGSAWTAPAAVNVNGAIPILENPVGVNAVAVNGTDVYVGGDFRNIASGAAVLPAGDFIARWDSLSGSWFALGSNGAGDGALNGMVSAIAFSGPNLYVGGKFTDVNDNGVLLSNADYIARWDGLHWNALGNNGAGNGSLNAQVLALAVSGTDLYVGGVFQNVRNGAATLTTADYLARWNGSAWFAISGDGGSNGSLNAPVFALAASGPDLYVGGAFSDVNSGGSVLYAADFLVRWNGAAWSALGSNGALEGSLNDTVFALAVSGTSLYVGGSFTNVNNAGKVLAEADRFARWDGANWHALGNNGAGDGVFNGPVYAIVVNGASVFVGGLFNQLSDRGILLPADNIARWNGLNWSALSSTSAGASSLNNPVTALALSGTRLYAGGLFTDVTYNGQKVTAADYAAWYEIPPMKFYAPLVRK